MTTNNNKTEPHREQTERHRDSDRSESRSTDLPPGSFRYHPLLSYVICARCLCIVHEDAIVGLDGGHGGEGRGRGRRGGLRSGRVGAVITSTSAVGLHPQHTASSEQRATCTQVSRLTRVGQRFDMRRVGSERGPAESPPESPFSFCFVCLFLRSLSSLRAWLVLVRAHTLTHPPTYLHPPDRPTRLTD